MTNKVLQFVEHYCKSTAMSGLSICSNSSEQLENYKEFSMSLTCLAWGGEGGVYQYSKSTASELFF